MNSMFDGVVIDAGHGGVDSGAIGNGILEKDYNLLISKYMYDRFKELGIPVYLTRDSDITLNPSERVEKVLSYFGDSPNVIVISNHVNAGGGDGAEIIYALRDSSKLSDMILEEIENTGQNGRRVYQRRLPSNPMKDYYYMLRDTGNTEAVIVEYGFIDNDNDISFLKDNYKKLADGVVKAILEYKNIPYTDNEVIISDTYKVMKGDTLYGIANKLDTSVDELKKLNGLSGNTISIGQVLKVPTKIVDLGDTELYQVKSGDTLYGIANKYGLTVKELKGLNNLTSDKLAIGQLLNVPSGLSNVNTYVVSKGDTLYSIAKRFGISVDKIKEANDLVSNMISVGDKLIIPFMNDMTYVVKKGDTLYSIAKKFNTSVEELKKLNNLVDDVLSIGKILMLK